MGKLMHINYLKVKTAVVLCASKKNDPHEDPFLRDVFYYYLVDTGAHHKDVLAVRKIPIELIDKYDSIAGALGAMLEKETLDWDLGFTYSAGTKKKEFFEQLLPEDEELLPISYDSVCTEEYMEVED